MKKLVWQLILPLTIISFVIFTKWWYVLPVDAPGTFLRGFPFPYEGRGWHTSMSHQFFLLEFGADLFTYFIFWLILVFCLHRFGFPLRIPKVITIILLGVSVVALSLSILFVSNKDNVFYRSRYFGMQVKATGYQFIWQDNPSRADE